MISTALMALDFQDQLADSSGCVLSFSGYPDDRVVLYRRFCPGHIS